MLQKLTLEEIEISTDLYIKSEETELVITANHKEKA